MTRRSDCSNAFFWIQLQHETTTKPLVYTKAKAKLTSRWASAPKQITVPRSSPNSVHLNAIRFSTWNRAFSLADHSLPFKPSAKTRIPVALAFWESSDHSATSYATVTFGTLRLTRNFSSPKSFSSESLLLDTHHSGPRIPPDRCWRSEITGRCAQGQPGRIDTLLSSLTSPVHLFL